MPAQGSGYLGPTVVALTPAPKASRAFRCQPRSLRRWCLCRRGRRQIASLPSNQRLTMSARPEGRAAARAAAGALRAPTETTVAGAADARPSFATARLSCRTPSSVGEHRRQRHTDMATPVVGGSRATFTRCIRRMSRHMTRTAIRPVGRCTIHRCSRVPTRQHSPRSAAAVATSRRFRQRRCRFRRRVQCHRRHRVRRRRRRHRAPCLWAQWQVATMALPRLRLGSRCHSTLLRSRTHSSMPTRTAGHRRSHRRQGAAERLQRESFFLLMDS